MVEVLRLRLHDRWDEPPVDAADLVRYLESGAVVLARRSRTIDEVSPVRGPVVPTSVLTDGEWVWHAGHAYYVRTHRVALPEDFVAHVRARGGATPSVSPQVLGELRRAVIEGRLGG